MSERTDICAAATTALFGWTATLGEMVVTGAMPVETAQRIVRAVRGLLADLARVNGDLAMERRAQEYLSSVARFVATAAEARPGPSRH